MVELYERSFGPLDVVQDGDLELIAQPIDFLGVNFYRPNLVAAGTRRPAARVCARPSVRRRHTAMGWPIVPAALTELLRPAQARLPRHTALHHGERRRLPRRAGRRRRRRRRAAVAYLQEHIAAVERAIAEGVDVRGYYVWSLLDNFEWEHGYAKRFGLVYVDYPTQRRVLKRSALWYRDLIAAQEQEA